MILCRWLKRAAKHRYERVANRREGERELVKGERGRKDRKARHTGRKAGGKDMLHYGKSCQDAIYFHSVQKHNSGLPEQSQ